MPFQSEKQRRYMHANLPEIAKRWERDYANGGMASQGGMKNYLGEQPMVNAPKYWQSAPDHEMTELAYITPKERDVLVNMNMYGTMDGSPNEGPSGIMSLNGWGDASQGFGTSGGGTKGTGGHSYGDRERYKSVDVQGPPNIHGGTTRTIGPTTPKDTFKQSWSGQPGFLGFGGGYRNLNVPGDTSQGHQSRFGGLGGLLMGVFGGIPGKIGSMLSHINPGKLRGWNEQYGRYNTQDEYKKARQDRINEKRMGYLSDRKSKGLGYGKQAYSDLLTGKTTTGKSYSDPFQDAINRDLQINPETTQFARSHLQSLANKQALTNKLSTPNRSLGQIVMDARRTDPYAGIENTNAARDFPLKGTFDKDAWEYNQPEEWQNQEFPVRQDFLPQENRAVSIIQTGKPMINDEWRWNRW